MPWGECWRSKYKISSYSGEFEFRCLFFFVKCILILLARRDSGELQQVLLSNQSNVMQLSVSRVVFIVSAFLWAYDALLYIGTDWASSWDYGTYHIGNQQRLRRACPSAQSRQSLRCSHTWSMEVDKGSDQKSDILPNWMAAHVVWRMSLQRTKSAIISWPGSIGFYEGGQWRRRKYFLSHVCFIQ